MYFINYFIRCSASHRSQAFSNKLYSAFSAHKLLYCLLTILCISSLISGIKSSISSATRPWPFVQIKGHVDNLQVDPKDGSVFVVLDGDIHKYDEEFNIISSTLSSSSDTKVTSNINHELVNKLLLYIDNGGSNLLFACWQTKALMVNCALHKADKLSSATPLLWPVGSKGFKTDLNDKITALVDPNDATDLLLTADRLTVTNQNVNDSEVPQLPALGRFKMVKNPNKIALEQQSVLPYQFRLNDYNLMYEYVYQFHHDSYTYFVLNDIRRPISSSKNKDVNRYIRLARVCQKDLALTSYLEISLTCNNQPNLVAKAAHLNFDEARNETILYIIAETAENLAQSMKRINPKSTLCWYPMGLCTDYMNKAVKDCQTGQKSTQLLDKMYPEPIQSIMCQRAPIYSSSDWCTSRANPFIDGSSDLYKMNEDGHVTLEDMTGVSFIHAKRQGTDQAEVIFLGTTHGLFAKINPDGEFYYTVDLNNGITYHHHSNDIIKTTTHSNFTSIEKTSRYSVASQNALITTADMSLNRLDLDACYYYSTCSACLDSKDPVRCVWCQGKCTKKKDCDINNQLAVHCEPLIKNFRPQSGPLSGQTKLVIEGENFGSAKAKLEVKLGRHNCTVDREHSTEEMITCLTNPVSAPETLPVSVNISDETTYIYTKGSSISRDRFEFVPIKVFGLHPSMGSRSGGTTIHIVGENLNAGSNRTVMLGDSECRVFESNKDGITCLTGRMYDERFGNSTKPDLRNLRIFVDGIEQQLEPRARFKNRNLSATFMVVDGLTVDAISAGEIIVSDQIHILSVIAAIILVGSLAALYMFKPEIPSKILLWKPFRKSGLKKTEDQEVVQNGVGNSKVDENPLAYFGPEMHPLMNTLSAIDKLRIQLEQEGLLIQPEQLRGGHLLGAGQFGRVHKGFLKIPGMEDHLDVAVKTIAQDCWNEADIGAFLQEGLMMKDFDHENVLPLIGVVFESKTKLPMVVTPFMLYGDLRTYISDESSSPTVKELIDFGIQVANGMAYLSALKFVHRDLAARNCMLDDNLVVKIADFGLSRDIYERDYYSSDNKKSKLPVKWMAIESLESGIYTTKTDVWSYGVLLWELMTRGVVPYPDVDNFDLFKYLKEGRRMPRPRYCPVLLYQIMRSCWDEDPSVRPPFNILVEKVSAVITQLKVAKDEQQTVCRDSTYCDVSR